MAVKKSMKARHVKGGNSKGGNSKGLAMIHKKVLPKVAAKPVGKNRSPKFATKSGNSKTMKAMKAGKAAGKLGKFHKSLIKKKGAKVKGEITIDGISMSPKEPIICVDQTILLKKMKTELTKTPIPK
jgi:hypothetical protein